LPLSRRILPLATPLFEAVASRSEETGILIAVAASIGVHQSQHYGPRLAELAERQRPHKGERAQKGPISEYFVFSEV